MAVCLALGRRDKCLVDFPSILLELETNAFGTCEEMDRSISRIEDGGTYES
jgi:hypothetical protein